MLLSHLHTTHFHSTFANIQGALPSASDTTGGANPLLAFQMLLVLKANSLRGWEPNIIRDYRRKKRQSTIKLNKKIQNFESKRDSVHNYLVT